MKTLWCKMYTYFFYVTQIIYVRDIIERINDDTMYSMFIRYFYIEVYGYEYMNHGR